MKFFEFYPELKINAHRWKVTHLKNQIKKLRAENPDAEDQEIMTMIEYRPIMKGRKPKINRDESL